MIPLPAQHRLRKIRRALAVFAAVALGGLILQPVQVVAGGRAVVTSVMASQAEGRLQLVVATTGPVRHRLVGWTGKPPTVIVVDLQDAELAIPAGPIPVGHPDVVRARIGQFDPTTVRVVVELRTPRPFTIQPSFPGHGIVLAIAVPRSKPVAVTAKPVASTQPVLPPAAQAQAPGAPQRYTLEFRDARLADVMAALARLAGLNIVVSPEAAAKTVTVRLVNVTLEEALTLLTQPLGLGWTRLGANVLIVPADQVPGPPVEIRYYRLRYAKAEEVAKQIEPLLFGRRTTAQVLPLPVATPAPTAPASPAPGAPPAATPAPPAPVVFVERTQIAVDARTNTLIVAATPADHARVAEIIRQLDIPVPVSAKTTRIYPLRWLFADLKAGEGSGPAREIGAEVVALLKAHLSPDAVVTFDYQNNAVVVTAIEGDQVRAQELLSQIDVPGPQLLIQASAVDINLDGLRDLGVEWTIATLPFNEEPTSPGQILFNPITRSPLNLLAQIGLLVREGKGRLLANPRVITKDGQTAEIFVGDQIPVVTGFDERGRPIIQTIDAGTKLNITPKINPDGLITVRILTEVGSLLQVGTQIGRSVRRAFTTLTVRDGSPIVIAGLIRNEDRTRVVKVPLLGDIPILGYLFRREITERSNREVVFVITPRALPRGEPSSSPTPSP
jgi:type II secretory pathway component GspD/PulD (secretin)